MARMSTKAHGVLDFLTAGTLAALPRMLGWGDRLTNTMTTLAIGTVGYSLLTNYEFGLIRVLPMRAHLAIDAMSGVGLCAASALFPEEDDETRKALIALGLFEIAASLMTRPEPFEAEGRHMAHSLGQESREGPGYGAAVQRSSTASML